MTLWPFSFSSFPCLLKCLKLRTSSVSCAEIGLQGSPGALQMQGPTRCPRYLLGGVETLGMCLSSIRCSALSTCCCKKLTTFAIHVLPPVCSVVSRECASLSGTMQAVDIGGNHVVSLSLTRLHSPMLAPTLACLQWCLQPNLLAISACMDFRSSSHCFMPRKTQTDKQQTEKKGVPLFGRLLTALWQRRNWTLWWEPCRLVGSHSCSMHTPCLHLHFAVP